MEKARQIKEEVNMATSDLKQFGNEAAFLNKTGKYPPDNSTCKIFREIKGIR
jgi:hypothetical protein